MFYLMLLKNGWPNQYPLNKILIMVNSPNAHLIQDLESIIDIQQQVVTSTLHFDELMQLICERTQELTHASAAVVEIVEGEEMVYRSVSGTAQHSLGVRLNIHTSLSGLSVKTNEVLYAEDTEIDERVDRDACRRVGARSMICVPLVFQSKAIGVLKVYSEHVKKFSDREISVLKITAGLLSASISQTREREEKEAAYLSMTENENKFRTLFENSYDSVMILKNGLVIDVNNAFEKFFGYTRDEILGQSVFKIVHPNNFDRVTQNISQGYELPYEADCVRKDGQTIIILATGKTIDLNGEKVRMSTLRDVTEQKKLERALRESEAKALETARAKSEFLANMSHEIRTPLNGVVGMANLLSDTQLDRTQLKYLDIIRSSADTLLTIVNDILDFSKIEAKKLVLEKVDFELKPAVEDIQQILSFTATQKGLNFECHFDKNLPQYINSDPTRLRQIILNLVSNAIKFTKKGSVTVEVKQLSRLKDKSHLEFKVTDTGIGIPQSALPILFQSFSQVDSSTTRKYGGTGLGLSICRQLVEMMGGKIGVKSVEGHGSTFWFDIVVPVAENIDKIQPIKFDIQTMKPKKWRVLVAEDNTVNQMIVKSMLQKAEHIVTIVANGQEALDALSIAPYDVVLMDCQMPEMDGFEATKKIRQAHQKWSQIPIIAMTAHAMAGDRERCIAAGMDDYVTKPMRIENLFSVLQKNFPKTLV